VLNTRADRRKDERMHASDRRDRDERFDVWAPRPERVRLLVDGHEVGMRPDASRDGWWMPDAERLAEALDQASAEGAAAADGSGREHDYGYLIDDAATPVPPPTARRLPDGVHGLARTDDAAFEWHDADWRGRPLDASAVLYELHVGAFTPEGTLDAAIARLDHLADLGVTHVELMPVAAFNGDRGWGYDGVAWYAVHEAYGGPEAYRRFVDACHARSLAVVQDVVYNHFGPSGNYAPMFGPYLREGHGTGWGDALNLDGPGSDEVRRFVLDNARMWIDDLHVDALRLDAVHALVDSRATHLLEELSRLARELRRTSHPLRPIALIAEDDTNGARMTSPIARGGHGLDAQWSDDFHHAVHVALTGETGGYYADFAAPGALAKVIERGYFHDGTWSSFRGRHHGRPLGRETPSTALVVCAQNHDQVGNRARGDRPSETLSDDELAIAAVLTLASPFSPMLFMGEEWGTRTPFPFFSSHPEPELARATSEGRLREFTRMGWDESAVPDPQDPATFEAAKLDWEARSSERGRRFTGLYRALIRARREEPDLARTPEIGSWEPGAFTDTQAAGTLVRGAASLDDDGQGLFVVRRGRTLVIVNRHDEAREFALPAPADVTADRRQTSSCAPRIVLASRDGAASLDQDAGLVRLDPVSAVVVADAVPVALERIASAS